MGTERGYPLTGISGCVICFNEEARIADCLRSLDFCDEIVVVDSFSTDRTLEVVEGLRASGELRVPLKLLRQEFLGHVEQKNFAVAQAAHDWIYVLDADERVDAELRASIAALRAAGSAPYAAYENNRATYYCLDFIRHGGWYPDRKTRFFQKARARWTGRHVHETLDAGGLPIGRLAGEIRHYSFGSIRDHLRTIQDFTDLAAREYVERGRKVGFWRAPAHSAAMFFKMYVVRAGFLDGRLGFILAAMSAFHVFAKYSKIWVEQMRPRARFVADSPYRPKE